MDEKASEIKKKVLNCQKPQVSHTEHSVFPIGH